MDATDRVRIGDGFGLLLSPCVSTRDTDSAARGADSLAVEGVHAESGTRPAIGEALMLFLVGFVAGFFLGAWLTLVLWFLSTPKDQRYFGNPAEMPPEQL